MPVWPVVRGLALSCHPLPTVAVTVMTAGLARLAGVPLESGVLLVLAVFTGQLSIGWSNDWIDAARDRSVQRAGKPVAAGQVSPAWVAGSALLALAATVAFSAWLGWRPGCAALVVVVCGWAYNLGLKATVLSFLPYAIAFGKLPAAATLAARPSLVAALWALVAGALLGVAAHFANVLPDLAEDAATGVRGLPHRLGARWVALTTPVLLFAGTVVIVAAPGGSGAGSVASWRWWLLIPIGAAALAGGLVGLRRPASRWVFAGVLVAAAADIVLFAASGGSLI